MNLQDVLDGTWHCRIGRVREKPNCSEVKNYYAPGFTEVVWGGAFQEIRNAFGLDSLIAILKCTMSGR